MKPSARDIVFAITSETKHVTDFTADELACACEYLITESRAGCPVIDNATYDRVFLSALRQADPGHPLLVMGGWG